MKLVSVIIGIVSASSCNLKVVDNSIGCRFFRFLLLMCGMLQKEKYLIDKSKTKMMCLLI